MRLYHTGYSEIKYPDIHYGRKNADFGQGFYLSDDDEFSKRWAKERNGEKTYLNCYELSAEDLKIKRLKKDTEWFDYILQNRAGKLDILAEYDIIIGPIANDTIYNTMGILTSGLLDRKTILEILMVGSTYEQIVIKTEKAVSNLRFISSSVLAHEEIESYKDIVKQEETAFQKAFAEIVENSFN